MSAELVDVSGRVLTIRVSGLLTQPQLAASQWAAGEAIDKFGGQARLLIIIEDFRGVAKEGDWSDVSFQLQYDDALERIAIVCESQWREASLLFTGEGIRRVRIQHFLPDALEKARAWAGAE
ncbi:MAG: STAS/SEC14 domain-containing protein [Verrucomicrobiota bacterium]